MVHLYDVVDEDELRAMLDGGFVRETRHPTLPLHILNYAEKTQYERAWNDTTLACRGLIYDATDGIVLARPWRKFFNYGEIDLNLDPTEPVEVTDKMDGSLGILVQDPGLSHAPLIATRGSFASEQAVWATRHYRGMYEGSWYPDPGLTYLFEIIYPKNRIVLDYKGMSDLVLLGAVETATGKALGPSGLIEWPGLRTQVFPAKTIEEALTLSPRPNAEGVVLRCLRSNSLVKIKQADYVALHKLVTGLNERAVWERLGAGETVASICEQLPDEFHRWVHDVAMQLLLQKCSTIHVAEIEHQQIIDGLPEGWQRKDYAAVAGRSPRRSLLFMLLDGRDPSEFVWKSLRPAADNRLCPITEDVA